MPFNGEPAGAINSNPIQTKVGTKQTNLFTATSTKVTQGSDGRVNGGTTTLYYSPDAGIYVPSATTTDGGKSWTYLNDSNGKPVLGADAKKSLEQGALKNNTQLQIQSAATSASIPKEQQKALATQTQNTATSGPGGDQQGGTSISSLNTAIGNADARTSYGDYRYPKEMKGNQDCIKFTMFTYKPKSFGSTSETIGSFTGTNRGTRCGSVSVPIQPTISDTNTVQWGGSELNAFQAAAGNIALQAIGGGNVTKTLEEIIEAAGKDKGNLTAAAAAYFAGQGVGANNTFFTRVTGGILNNNLELLFEGPQLRTFNFNISMSARHKEEAQEIKKIIRFFKQGMSVKRTEANLFLKSPHIFGIQYCYNGTDNHPWINMIKDCALQSCSVNYTPAGNYATFEDGAMTQYDISLVFGEIEPIYDDDYTKLVPGGDSDTHIGF